MKRLYAVLGDRVDASLSPRLHTAAGTACGIDLAYVPVICRDETHFRRVVVALAELGAGGANVTIPYKHLAAELCDHVTDTAADIGAVNTLTFHPEGSLSGHNTDGPALERLFGRLPPGALRKVQVLGAGGASRAVLWALRQVGAGEVHVSARRIDDDWPRGFGAQSGALAPIRGVTLVVSTLPGDRELARSAVETWIDTGSRPYIYDAAYGGLDRPSPLVIRARAAGLVAVDGLGMLVEQAALALERWSGHDVEPIRMAMRGAVGLTGNDDPFDSNSGAD